MSEEQRRRKRGDREQQRERMRNATEEQAGTKLGPDQLGSLDPGRINSDQPGST